MDKYFKDIIKTYFTDFTGTATPKQFWGFILGVLIVALALSYISTQSRVLGTILYVLFILATMIPCIAITIRRVRDAGIYPDFGFLSVFCYAYIILSMFPESVLNWGIIKILMAFLTLVSFVSLITLIIFCLLPTKQED